MNFKENDFNCGKRHQEACAVGIDDYRRLHLLRDDEGLCERHFSMDDKGQEKEYSETVALLLRFGCNFKEVRLEGLAFLFIPKSDVVLIDNPSKRSRIKRIL